MKIEAVDFFYLAMPEITTEADGSQDALLVRVAAGGHVGWGECEASPLPSIAAFVCPMSHGVCRPVGASVLGQPLDGPADIARMSAAVAYDSMDLLQAAHTLSGVEMALWDLLGKARGEPVWRAPRLPDEPSEDALRLACSSATRRRRRWSWPRIRADGFRAAKFGWGPIGRGTRRRRTATSCGRARGPGPGRHPAGRRRPDLQRGRRARRRAPAGAGGAGRDLARGAVPRPAPTTAYGALAQPQRQGQARRRRGCAQRATWRATSSTTAASASSRSTAAASAASARPRRSPTTRRRGRHLRQPHLHLQPGALRLAASPMPASPTTASASIRSRPSPARPSRATTSIATATARSARRTRRASASRSRRRGCGNISSMSRSRWATYALPDTSRRVTPRRTVAGWVCALWHPGSFEAGKYR